MPKLITKRQLTRFKEEYRLFDQNGDGKLSNEEFQKFVDQLDPDMNKNAKQLMVFDLDYFIFIFKT